MFFAYFDESGDPGLQNSPSPFFTLAALIIKDSDWNNVLNVIKNFRRQLRSQYGLLLNYELKANYLLHNKGDLRILSLSKQDRLQIYLDVMNFISNHNSIIKVFSVYIDKRKIINRAINVREFAWTYALQRVQRYVQEKGDRALIFPDEGHYPLIKKLMRKMRRFHYIPSFFNSSTRIQALTDLILEDPNDRKSHESYFVQLADLCAYAASRYVLPIPSFSQNYWGALGSSRLNAVNNLRGGPTGIVKWP